MKISSRMRYAARAVFFLARAYGHGPVALRHISEDQKISFKFLENVMRPLVAAGIVKSEMGNKGGYYLARHPKDLNMYDVLHAAGGLRETDFYIKEPESDTRLDSRAINDVWSMLGEKIQDQLKSVSFQQMLDKQSKMSDELSMLKKEFRAI